MKLVSVYRHKDAIKILYDLLKERPPEACISHKKTPSFAKHKKFVRSAPYKYWYLILDYGTPIGAIYLSYNNEIGAHLIRGYEKHTREALETVIDKHPRAFLANVSMNDVPRKKLLRRMGFKPIQITYKREPLY